jgi:hypothetical protein
MLGFVLIRRRVDTRRDAGRRFACVLSLLRSCTLFTEYSFGVTTVGLGNRKRVHRESNSGHFSEVLTFIYSLNGLSK